MGRAVTQRDRHSGQSSSRPSRRVVFDMKQGDDAKGGKCRPISPPKRSTGQLQLFPSVRLPRCGAATRANSLLTLIIHAVYFDSPLDFAERRNCRLYGPVNIHASYEGERRKKWQPKIRITRAGRGAVHQASSLSPCFPPAAGPHASHAASCDTASFCRT